MDCPYTPGFEKSSLTDCTLFFLTNILQQLLRDLVVHARSFRHGKHGMHVTHVDCLGDVSKGKLVMQVTVCTFWSLNHYMEDNFFLIFFL